jgi:SRSO17 transposase
VSVLRFPNRLFADSWSVGFVEADAVGSSNWGDELERWLQPFLARLGNKTRRRMCPLYIAGLIGPGERKSIQPMAERFAPGNYDQLHHFIAAGVWDAAPLEAELLVQADRMVGGDGAVLVIDDTALPKKGSHSVGVAPQYASALGKTANCQTLVSLTLAKGEVPVMVGLRLFLPESWTGNPARMQRARVPAERQALRSKPEIAIAEIDRIIAAGVRFGCVLADAGYGLSAPFRQALSERQLRWAVGIPRHQKVYPADVRLVFPVSGHGRPRQQHIPDQQSVAAEIMLSAAFSRMITWRNGTKGRLSARFAAMRVRVADGRPQRIRDMGGQHMPGEEVWLVGEHRATGERKYYLSNLAAETSLKALARTIKARWICEQAHQQLKEELGLDHFEGRSWTGLHRHALMTMIAYAFLQSRRIREASGEKRSAGAPPQPTLPAVRRRILAYLYPGLPARCPHCRYPFRPPRGSRPCGRI